MGDQVRFPLKGPARLQRSRAGLPAVPALAVRIHAAPILAIPILIGALLSAGPSAALEPPEFRWDAWTARDDGTRSAERGRPGDGARSGDEGRPHEGVRPGARLFVPGWTDPVRSSDTLEFLPFQAFLLSARTEDDPVWPEGDGIRLPGEAMAGLEGGAALAVGRGLSLSGKMLLVSRSGGPWTGRLQGLNLSLDLDRYRLRLGRAPIRWGAGIQGGLLMGRSAPPLWSIQGATSRPLRLPGFLGALGSWRADAFLAYLDDPHRTIPNPLLMGQLVAWRPWEWFEVAGARTALFGGDGRTGRLRPSDLWDIFWARNENVVGERSPSDSDQRASLILRAYLPWLEGTVPGLDRVDGFYEYGGEDFLDPPLPSAVAHHYGGGLVWRGWAARGEFAETHTGRNRWYDDHTVYGASHYYRGFPLGLSMGADARALFLGIWSPSGPLQGRIWRQEQTHGLESGIREMRVTWGAGLRLRLDRGWSLEWELSRGRRVGPGREPLAPGFVRESAVFRVTRG